MVEETMYHPSPQMNAMEFVREFLRLPIAGGQAQFPLTFESIATSKIE